MALGRSDARCRTIIDTFIIAVTRCHLAALSLKPVLIISVNYQGDRPIILQWSYQGKK
jgi:hypothetical protein